jgi:DNA-binding MarR family transcriptional regulator
VGSIYDEIRQSRKFDRPEQEAAVALLRTADLLRTRIEAALKPHGISPEQYNVLRILRGAEGHRHRTLDILSRMIARAPNITRLIDKLAAKKLVSRCPGEGDRRVVVVQLTRAGLDFVQQVTSMVDSLDVAAFSTLKPGQVAALIRLLDLVRAGARREA